MKKMYFNVNNYRKNLLEGGVSKSVIELLLKNDKIYENQEVTFLHFGDAWGYVKGTKEMILREWCSSKKENCESFLSPVINHVKNLTKKMKKDPIK
jgi:hypothetical protein